MSTAKKVEVRVLAHCQHGKPNDVVALDADDAKDAEKAGLVDSNAAAVKYAKSLQPKKAAGDEEALEEQK